MNINVLLLSSAAALLAVSGVRAADAEAEPAEYVKICDVYGAGYFYIPGTQTCLRIGGYVRYDAGFGDAGSFDGRRAQDAQTGKWQDSWNKLARFTLNTWTAQETELGTLKTFTENHINYSNGENLATLNYAWIQLGGLRVGADDSAFDEFPAYAGNVIQDTLVPYGGFETNLIQYTLDAGKGFSAIISLEQGNSDDTEGYSSGTIDSYVPNVVAGVKYAQDWGSIVAVGAYDSNYEEWSGKVRLDVKASEQLSLWIMGGYGTEESVERSFYKLWGGKWALWGGGSYQITKKTALNAQLSYDADRNFSVAANVAHTFVPGFTITAEVNYIDSGKSDWTKIGVAPGAASESAGNAIGGIVRFQRDF